MKRLPFFLLLFLLSNAWGLSVPERPMGRVHDEANLLTSDQRTNLESKLASFEAETTNQIVVAIFPSLEGESLEDFSIRLAEKWKIGQKGKDNGIILLIFPNDRRLRIEVGYGLESVVPDAYASRIIEEKLKPNFRQGNFYTGIDQAVDSLMAATRGVYEPIAAPMSPTAGPPWFVILFLMLFFSIFIFAIVSSIRRHGWKGAFSSGGRGWTYGGSSSGGWSGGGGGFSGGGGSFGGGGSSGSW